jgi:hypothetical protein
MAETMTLISAITVDSGGASSINFTSIPQTYTDLLLKVSARNSDTGTANNLYVGFNGVNTNQSAIKLVGTGSSASASSDGNIIANMVASSATSNTFNNAEIYIPNYTVSQNKSVSIDSVNENNATDATLRLEAGLWSSTAAITSINLTGQSGNFVQYSTAYLYGIKNS